MELYNDDCLKMKKNNQEIVEKIHEIYMDAEQYTLRQRIAEHFIPTEEEKKGQAEIPTPVKLVDEMLDKMPEVFWTSPKKVLEPCCGKGNFVLGIYDRFFKGLEKMFPDEEERRQVIVEECLWFCDLSPLNVFITSELVRCHSYGFESPNTSVGDTLQKSWDFQFDAVIGNPPYNLTENSRNTLWDLFVKYSIKKLDVNGLLLYVHPALWRKPTSNKSKMNGLFKLMTTDNTIIYLEIHNTRDGMKTFKCGTRYDYYLLKKKVNENYKSKIIDEDGIEHKMDLSKLNWLSNKNYELIEKITNSNEKINIIYSRSAYGNDKKWTNKTKSEKFKYPCVLTTPEKGIRYMYSEHKNNGHFGIKKVIFGETSTYNSFYDDDGSYGLTDGAIAIQEDNSIMANNILTAIKSEKFNGLLKSCSWSNYRIEWNMLKDLNKNFWKEYN
jgi:hypothetical protein